MIIKRLKLNNIRNHVNSDILFPNGRILIEGDNGSGKTTILLSIEYALFGSEDKGMGYALLRNGSQNGYIHLFFEVNGKEYEIYRGLARKGNSVNAGNCIMKGGHDEYKTVGEIKARVLKLLGFREPSSSRTKGQIYRYAMFTVQGEMTNFILSNKKEDINNRFQVLRRAFGMERYKLARETANKIAIYVDNKAKDYEADTRGLDNNRLKLMSEIREVSRLENESKEFGEQINNYDKELYELSNKIDGLRTERKKFDGVKLQKDIIDKQTKQKRHEKQELDNSTDNLKLQLQELPYIKRPVDRNIEDLTREREGLRNERDSLKNNRQHFDSVGKELSQKDTDIAIKKGQINDIINSINDENAIIEGINTELKELLCTENINDMSVDNLDIQLCKYRESLTKLNQELGGINKDIERFESIEHKDECPTCGHKVDKKAFVDKIKVCKDVQADINTKIGDFDKNIGNIDKEISIRKKLIGSKQRISKHTNHITLLDKDIDKLKDGREELADQLSLYRDPSQRIEECNNNIERLDELIGSTIKFDGIQKDIERLKKQITDDTSKSVGLENDIRISEEESVKYSQDSEVYDRLTNEIDGYGTEVVDINKKISGINNKKLTSEVIQQEKIKNKEGIEREITKQMENERKSKLLKDHHKWLKEFFIPTVERIEKDIFANTKKEFSRHFRKWTSSLIDNKSIKVSIDDNFTPVIEHGGNAIDINYLSGGEQASIALAYRLILNKLVTKYVGMKDCLLILDEPTYGFSRGRLSTNVSNMIKDLKHDQIIIVSHEVTLRDCVEHVFIVTDNNGIANIEIRS